MDPAKLTLGQILKDLTVPQLVGVVTIAIATHAAAYQVGALFSEKRPVADCCDEAGRPAVRIKMPTPVRNGTWANTGGVLQGECFSSTGRTEQSPAGDLYFEVRRGDLELGYILARDAELLR